MRVLYLSNTYDETKGWGRYAFGFLTQGKRLLGEGNAVSPDPETLWSRQPSLMRMLLLPFDVIRLYRTARAVDGIHALTEIVAPLAFLLSIVARKPYVVSAVGAYSDLNSYRRSVRWLYRLAFQRATRLAVLSHYTAEVVRHNVPEARMTIVYGGFTPPAHVPGRTLASAERRILSVGALKPRKGFHSLVEAVRLLSAEGFKTRCDIAGPIDEYDDYRVRIEEDIRKGGLGDRVVLHGKVAQSELERLYRDADLFVLASEHHGTGFEGLGLVYLEALSYGLPVIGCRDSGAEDIIDGDANGRLVSPGDPVALAAAIRESFDPPTWAKRSAAASRSVEKFRWEKVGSDMHALQLEAFHQKR